MDLLGENGNPDKKIVKIASTIAHQAFLADKKQFAGWAGLRKMPDHIVIYKNEVKEGPHKNEYHCEISREKYRSKETARAFAFELMTKANELKLFIEPIGLDVGIQK